MNGRNFTAGKIKKEPQKDTVRKPKDKVKPMTRI